MFPTRRRTTCVILKPDATIRGSVAAQILQRLLAKGFIPLQFAELQATPSLIRRHYANSFGNLHALDVRLACRYMTCCKILVIKFTDDVDRGRGVVDRMRMFAGDSDSDPTDPYLIRNEYRIVNALINTIHSSDCDAESARELRVWAPHLKQQAPHKVLRRVKQYIAQHLRDPCASTTELRQIGQELIDAIRDLKFEELQICGPTRYAQDSDELLQGEAIKRFEKRLAAAFYPRLPESKHARKCESAKELARVMVEYYAHHIGRNYCRILLLCLGCLLLLFVVLMLVATFLDFMASTL